MIVQILGAIDLIGIVVLMVTEEMSMPALLFFGFLFISKSLFDFLKSFASWIDFVTGITILFSIAFEIPVLLKLILIILLLQKGVLSFL
jgi:Sec-independent protein secretion pathway component TatC